MARTHHPKPTRPQETKQERYQRRTARRRAAVCRQLAIRRGYRHAAPLIDELAYYASLSGRLPYPSQEKLALKLGVTTRTVQNWIYILESIGALIVYRSTPKLRDGCWTRQTNRYQLADITASRAAPSSPIRRRNTGNPRLSPTRNQLRVSPTGTEPTEGQPKACTPPNRSSGQEKKVLRTQNQILGPPTPKSDGETTPKLDRQAVTAILDEARAKLGRPKAIR